MPDTPMPAAPAVVNRFSWLAVVRTLRVQQWVKNLLLFVPTVLDHRLQETPVLVRATLAFAAFCCAASGAYILNDLLDLEADRRHRTKRHRPFASGQVPARLGWVLAPALIAAGFAIALPLQSSHFTALLALYVATTTAYSVYLKRVAVLDVIVLAGLYTLRVLAGVAATGVRFSTWLLAFSMFLFLSLAFQKRYAELTGFEAGEREMLSRRGYQRADREWLGAMGGASGYLSVLVLALYINSEEVVVLYRAPLVLWLICPLLLYWTSRMWLRAYRGQVDEDPIVATVRDPSSYIVGALVALVLYAAL